MKADQLLDFCRESWHSCDGPIRFINPDSEETLFQKARELLTIYHDSWDHETQILAVKQPLAFDLRDHLPCHPNLPLFKGAISNVVSVKCSVVVLGLKDSSSRLSTFLGDNDDQLTECSIGAVSLGFHPGKYRLEVLITASKPDLVAYETDRGEHHRLKFLETVSGIWKAIQASIFYPKPDWYCKRCLWQTYCKDW